MTTQDYQIKNEEFITALTGLLHDRGLVANLRKWWSPATRYFAYPVLGRLRALGDDRKILIAALFAVHATAGRPPHSAGGASIGKAALTLAGGLKGAGFGSMEKHFRRLLAANDLADLGLQLHRLVKRLERESIPLDYARLLSDLRQFGKSPERIKTNWALDFWQAAEPTTPDSPQP